MSTESLNESSDAYEQLPVGLRNAIAGTVYEVRMREAVEAGIVPEGYTTHLFLHALGVPNSLNDADREFQAWLETAGGTK